MNGPKEEWRRMQVPMECGRGYYEVSNYGNVRHVYKRGTMPVRAMPKTNTSGSNYMVININNRHCRKQIKVAKAVWIAFRGPVPEGMCVVHKNGSWRDNALWNLKLMSRKELGQFAATAIRKYATNLRGENRSAYRLVARIDRGGNVLKWYRSARQAAKDDALMSYQAILDRCNHRLKREADIWVLGCSYVWEQEAYALSGSDEDG